MRALGKSIFATQPRPTSSDSSQKAKQEVFQACWVRWTVCIGPGRIAHRPGQDSTLVRRKSQQLYSKLSPPMTSGSGMHSLGYLDHNILDRSHLFADLSNGWA